MLARATLDRNNSANVKVSVLFIIQLQRLCFINLKIVPLEGIG